MTKQSRQANKIHGVVNLANCSYKVKMSRGVWTAVNRAQRALRSRMLQVIGTIKGLDKWNI